SKRPEGRAGWEEIEVLPKRQRAQNKAHARLRIPNFVAHHGAKPHLLRIQFRVVEIALSIAGKAIPSPEELFDFYVHAEIISQYLLERDGGTGLLCKKAGVIEERCVGNVLAVAQAFRAEADHVENILREPVAIALLNSDKIAVFPPCPIEERDQPVMKDVEEIAKRVVTRLNAASNQFGVVDGQHTKRADEAEKVHSHQRRTIGRHFKRLNFACRERQRRIHTETQDFVARKLEQADAAAFLIEGLHETDRLHEFEGIRLGEETVFDRSPHQSS